MAQTPLSPIPSLIDRTAEGSPVDPNSFGTSDRAFSRFFGEAADVATEILKNRKNQEDEDFVTNAILSDHRAIAREKLDSQYSVPEDGSGYAKRIREFSQSRLQAQADLAPSEDARRNYLNRANSLFTTHIIDADLKEAELRNKAFQNNIAYQADEMAKGFLDFPDHQSAIQQWQVIDDAIAKAVVEKRITPAAAAEISMRERNKAAHGLLDGYYNSERYQEGLGALLGTISPGSVSKNEPGSDYIDMAPAKAAEQGFITPEEAKELESKGATYRQPLSGVVEFTGLGFDGKSPLIEALSEAEKDKYIKQYKHAMLVSEGDKVSDINSRVSNARAYLMTGGNWSNSGAAEILNDIRANKHISKNQKAELMDDLISGDLTGRATQALRQLPRSRWAELEQGVQKELETNRANLLKEFPDQKGLAFPSFNAAKRIHDDHAFMVARDHLIKEQNKDAAGYAIQTAPSVRSAFAQAQDWRDPGLTQAYSERVMLFQKTMEIPDKYRRILPGAVAAQERKFFSSAQNGQQVSERIGQLQNAFGKYFPRVWGEISGNDANLRDFALISHIPARESRERIVNTIINKKDINDAFKDAGRDHKELSNAMNSEIRDLTVAMAGGSESGNRLGYINSLTGAVELEAKRQLIADPKISEKDAVRNAYSQVVGFNYQIAKADNSQVVVPSVVPGMQTAMDPKLLSSFMLSHKNQSVIKEMDTAIFPGFINTWKSAGIPESEWKDRWAEALSANGRWVNTKDLTGVRLVYDDPVTGRKNIQVVSPSGEPIQYGYDQIMSGKFPTAKYMYQENKGFFEKLFKKD